MPRFPEKRSFAVQIKILLERNQQGGHRRLGDHIHWPGISRASVSKADKVCWIGVNWKEKQPGKAQAESKPKENVVDGIFKPLLIFATGGIWAVKPRQVCLRRRACLPAGANCYNSFSVLGWLSGQKQQTVNLPGFPVRRFESYPGHHLLFSCKSRL